jgi:hypothetical protein
VSGPRRSFGSEIDAPRSTKTDLPSGLYATALADARIERRQDLPDRQPTRSMKPRVGERLGVALCRVLAQRVGKTLDVARETL